MLMLRQPPGGVPDDNVKATDYFLARVPIYGTRDAGRGFWKRLRGLRVDTCGMKENLFLTFFIHTQQTTR